MSRSRKKQPYAPFVGGGSQGEWKRIYNRRLRRSNSQLLQLEGEDAEFYTLDEKGNQYDGPYDGTKGYRGERPVTKPTSRWREISLEEAQDDWDRMMRK